MKHPVSPKPGEWFCDLRPMEGQGLYQNKFTQVTILIGINGKSCTCDFRNVNLKGDQAEKDLTEGIAKAKKIVNILNGAGPKVPETGLCAQCGKPCPEDDYLCRGCRL